MKNCLCLFSMKKALSLLSFSVLLLEVVPLKAMNGNAQGEERRRLMEEQNRAYIEALRADQEREAQEQALLEARRQKELDSKAPLDECIAELACVNDVRAHFNTISSKLENKIGLLQLLRRQGFTVAQALQDAKRKHYASEHDRYMACCNDITPFLQEGDPVLVQRRAQRIVQRFLNLAGSNETAHHYGSCEAVEMVEMAGHEQACVEKTKEQCSAKQCSVSDNSVLQDNALTKERLQRAYNCCISNADAKQLNSLRKELISYRIADKEEIDAYILAFTEKDIAQCGAGSGNNEKMRSDEQEQQASYTGYEESERGSDAAMADLSEEDEAEEDEADSGLYGSDDDLCELCNDTSDFDCVADSRRKQELSYALVELSQAAAENNIDAIANIFTSKIYKFDRNGPAERESYDNAIAIITEVVRRAIAQSDEGTLSKLCFIFAKEDSPIYSEMIAAIEQARANEGESILPPDPYGFIPEETPLQPVGPQTFVQQHVTQAAQEEDRALLLAQFESARLSGDVGRILELQRQLIGQGIIEADELDAIIMSLLPL